jgi:hypothetical protein
MILLLTPEEKGSSFYTPAMMNANVALVLNRDGTAYVLKNRYGPNKITIDVEQANELFRKDLTRSEANK